MRLLKTLTLATGLALLPAPTLHASPAPQKAAGKATQKQSAPRTIVSVEEVTVDCPVGTVPRLPYLVWVNYSDGAGEYRQTKWSNSALATEQEQADKTKHPAGSQYTIGGYVIGDNTTHNGYPITANIKVTEGGYNTPAAKPKAHTVPLTDVTVTGDNRLTSNRDLAIDQILSWDVTQQLYNYRDTYGLPTEGYTRSDGWDSPDTKLKGHGSGHYMSALALAYAAAKDPAKKAALKKNIKRMVDELRECQERTFVWNDSLGRYWEARDFAPEEELKDMKGTWAAFDEHKKKYAQYGYGYLNAIPAQHAALIEMYRAYNNADWVWAPYYSIHKQLAGLIDIANYVDDQEIADKALQIAKDMGMWVWNRMHYRTFVDKEGTQEERRSKPGNRYEMWNMYIAGEVGGIGESLARLSEMVTDPTEKARLIEASNCFDSPALFDPLSVNIDDIRNRHANMHIPMIVAALRSYLSNGDPKYYNMAENFWNMVQGRYAYAPGGVGNIEMFREPYTQILSMATNGMSEGDSESNPDINETCCVYNLLKLTKDLNAYNPDDARYMDYYERGLFNQIVGSLHPTEYHTTYQYAVGLNASKPWGNETPQSTCCGGTGSENHVKYQEATYFVADDNNTLWVALYMPTTMQWKEKGMTIAQDGAWPSENSTINITDGEGDFTMKLRVPYWATEGFEVKVNGEPVQAEARPSSYLELPKRNWKKGDKVEVHMPFTKHLMYGPDKLSAEVASLGGEPLEEAWVGTLMYGPLAMTATDVANWKEATLNLDSRLATVTATAPNGEQKGTEANLYTLSQGGRTFQPDYFRHDNSTHYFRINQVKDPTTELKMALGEKLRQSEAFHQEDYAKGYKELQAAVKSGRQLMELPAVSESEISEGMKAIDTAVEKLQPKGLNPSRLEQAVNAASALNSADYTTESYNGLQTALNAARNLKEGSPKQTDVDRQTIAVNDAVKALVAASSVDKSTLKDLLTVANERKDAQEKWNALEVKVPEYSPWARNGFMRLMWTMNDAQKVFDNADKNYSQGEVNAMASSLNSAINTMRPGNLPEIEDLRPLSGLLRRAGRVTAETSAELKDAIEYAQMVMKYVTDGSGTHDMIQTAVERLKKAASI